MAATSAPRERLLGPPLAAVPESTVVGTAPSEGGGAGWERGGSQFAPLLTIDSSFRGPSRSLGGTDAPALDGARASLIDRRRFTLFDVRIAITGSHGLIGSALVDRLVELGHDVVRIVRSSAGPDDISWDPAAGRFEASDLIGVDAVVNLAGAGIGDHRWTDDYRRTVLESRTRSTTLLAEAIAAVDGGPATMLSGSAIGFYGDRGDEQLDESSPSGDGFLAEVARDWEASTVAAREHARVVHLRTGIVLAEGGALSKMLPLFKLGLGGRFGSGRQWMSWISLTDEVAAIVHLLSSDLSGAVNLTAPQPVTNATFADTLGEVLHRPTFLAVPSFGPKLLLGGERADALLFGSQRVNPRVLVADGFVFAHPDLAAALRAVLDV